MSGGKGAGGLGVAGHLSLSGVIDLRGKDGLGMLLSLRWDGYERQIINRGELEGRHLNHLHISSSQPGHMRRSP